MLELYEAQVSNYIIFFKSGNKTHHLLGALIPFPFIAHEEILPKCYLSL